MLSVMEVRSYGELQAFTTLDGSEIREWAGKLGAPARNQSLAEATLEPGQATERHYHAEAEEIYYVVEPKTRLCWRDAGWNSAFV